MTDWTYDSLKSKLDAAVGNGDSTNGDSANGHHLPAPVDWDALYNRERDTEDWLVTDLWPKGRQISLTAPRKERKSLLMLYLAAHVAIGRDPWTQRPTTPTSVIYLDFEMSEDDLLERVEDMGFKAADLANLHYFLHPDMPLLDQQAGAKVMLELIDEHAAEAVIIDTFSRVIRSRDNSGDEVREFYRWSAQQVKARGVSLARLDHTGHTVTDRASGSASKGADVDVGWVIHRGDGATLSLQHHGLSRIGWVPERINLTLRDEPLHFIRLDQIWGPGTAECAADLDQLGVDVDVSANAVVKLLREAGKGRRRKVILDAVAWRRQQTDSGALAGGSQAFTRGGIGNPGTETGTETPEIADVQDGNTVGEYREPPGRAWGDGWGMTVGNPPIPRPDPKPSKESDRLAGELF